MILKGYGLPSIAEQASDKWLGGDHGRRLIKRDGRVPEGAKEDPDGAAETIPSS